ncbi:IS3 family transposase [Lacticaseibacillus saniviri]
METKIKAVETYVTGVQSKLSVARQFGISRSLFRILVAVYEVHGRAGLLRPAKITGQLRVSLVKWKQHNQASVQDTCAHFDVLSVEAVVRWERVYNVFGEQALLEMRQGVRTHHKRIRSGQDQAPRTGEFILADTRRRLKKITRLEEASKRQLSQVIMELRAKYRLVDLIRALPISMSVFQYWQKKLQEPDVDEELKRRVTEVFKAHKGTYGVPRVTAAIRKMYAKEGRTKPNHKRIQRIMSELGLNSSVYRKRTRKYDSSKGPRGRVAKNRLRRRNMANRPYQKLVTDVTELKATNGDKAYLEVIKDLWSNRIVSWAVSPHPNLEFALKPLNQLIKDLPQTGYQVTLHSDQGWQYQHRSWRKSLKRGRIKQSMSRRSTCLDNAACETVFDKLKTEIGQAKSYANYETLKTAIDEWINYYNTERIQIKLGGQSPLEFEQQLVA